MIEGLRPALADPAVFAGVYSAHHRAVYGAAYRILGSVCHAQDVTQDVFALLWRSPEKFDPRRGSLGGYLQMAARSRALDVWREGEAVGRKTDRLKLAVAVPEARVEDRPAAMAEREHDRSAVRDAMRRLPDAQRKAIVLAYWGGLTHEQIAGETRVPLGTVKGRLRLAAARIRAELEAAADIAEPLAALDSAA